MRFTKSGRILGMSPQFLLMIGMIVYTMAPVISVLASMHVAKALGCPLDEANIYPCNCMGIEIGGLLTVMFVAGWFALITIPTGVLGIVGYATALILDAFSKRRRQALKSRDD